MLATFSESFPKNRAWKGGKRNFTTEKPGKQHPGQVIKVGITNDVMVLACNLIWCGENFTSSL